MLQQIRKALGNAENHLRIDHSKAFADGDITKPNIENSISVGYNSNNQSLERVCQ